MLIFVRRVPVDITRLATPAPNALRVALALQKLQLALRHQIVFVLRILVLVPMAIR